MSRVFLYSDESGNFDFRRHERASRYFAVGTITLRDEEPLRLATDLMRLRVELAWRQMNVDSDFHATNDDQAVRDEVFKVLSGHPFQLDVTLLEKSKAQPQTRIDEATFYKYAWYYHLNKLVDRACQEGDSLMVVTAAIGTRRSRASFRTALGDVVRQCARRIPHRVAFWPAAGDPCLQAADYALWAVARKWERGDLRSHTLLSAQIRSEYDLWASGATHYY